MVNTYQETKIVKTMQNGDTNSHHQRELDSQRYRQSEIRSGSKEIPKSKRQKINK